MLSTRLQRIGGCIVVAATVLCVAPSVGAEARFGRSGFGITDQAENNTLWFGLRLQPRFVLSLAGDPATTDEARTTGTGFRVRRLQVMADGRLARIIEYKVQVDLGRFLSFTDGEGETRLAQDTILQDAWINLHVLDAFQLAFGQLKTPFVIQHVLAAGPIVFPDTSIATDGFRYGSVRLSGFSYGRDVGAMIQGWAPRRLVEYQIGVFLGDGMNVWPPEDAGFLYAARVAVQPLGALPNDEADLAREGPRLSLGLSGNVNHHPLYDAEGARAGSLEDLRVGGELRFMARGLSLTSEVFYAAELGDHEPGDTQSRRLGAYAQASYFVARWHLLPAVRYSRLDPDLDTAGDAVSSFEVAVNFFLPNVATPERGDDLGHFGKLVAAYELDYAEALAGPARHLLTIGVQVEF